MLVPGICSVTFRRLDPETVISLSAKAGLTGVEWGGDVHVPPGDLEKARKVRHLTEEAGLRVASYGSYFKTGCDGNFEQVLETASALGAPSIRIWAGDRGSAEADETWRLKMTEETRRIARLSRNKGIRLCYEYHNHSLTDNRESAASFMQAVNDDFISMYWQQELEKDASENLRNLTALSPWLSNIHVFHYAGREQQALEAGRDDWRRYLNALPPSPVPRYVLLEFVKNGDTGQFAEDAEILKALIKCLGNQTSQGSTD